jgi:hypothetical protein
LRFVITGEWNRNRLLQTIIACYALYVAALWLTNALLYFDRMSLSPDSVVAYYLGNEAEYRPARTYQGMLEVSHFHLFAMGMLLLVLTHLVLFVPVSMRTKVAMIALPFLSAALDEGGGWLVRFVSPSLAWVKVAGFVALQTSLAALIALALWAVFRGSSRNYSASAQLE